MTELGSCAKRKGGRSDVLVFVSKCVSTFSATLNCLTYEILSKQYSGLCIVFVINCSEYSLYKWNSERKRCQKKLSSNLNTSAGETFFLDETILK